jgi:REP element-mobilizing transposase RayT
MMAMDQPPPLHLATCRSTRLRGFDYASNAAYVVTICSYQRRPIFSAIADGQLQPSWLGRIVGREWHKTAELRRGVLLDAFILMPNHYHGILILNLPENAPRDQVRADPVGATCARPFQALSTGLEAIVRGFKSAVTAAARKERPEMGPVWQRGYYDRIIRSEAELERFRRYILDNPKQWELDRYFAGE